MAALDLLKSNHWGLTEARAQARHLLARSDGRRAARELVAALVTDDRELRKRAADVARRVTEIDAEFLTLYAAEFASVLAETPIAERRTRWHLGLVVARIARAPQEIRTATALMWQLSEDKSNGVRCSAVEGLGLLARRDRAIRLSVESYLRQSLATGTPAMRCRARDAIRDLQSIVR